MGRSSKESKTFKIVCKVLFTNKMTIKLIRQYIREQLSVMGGNPSRKVYTFDDAINSWDATPGYDIDIVPNVNGTYSVTIYYEDEKVTPIRIFNDNEEATHYARNFIDGHKLSQQNN